MKTHWRLPKGVDELLPPRAWDLELLRRRVLDVFDQWGFDYIDPPLIEYLDALLVGSGEDLDLQTLKVVDQISGRQLGVRADMTSQAVRVDAHSIITEGVQRLCYAGPVVFANPASTQTSRVQLKAGAEVFGAPSIDADVEVVGLMLEALRVAQINRPVLLLGHMGIYLGLVAELVAQGSLDEAAQSELFSCIQRKGASDIRALLDNSATADMLAALPDLMGDVTVLPKAAALLEDAPEPVRIALAELQSLAALIQANHPRVDLRFDVSELSGYGYHNGPVFAVYHPEHGSALAQGGRYDGVGAVFGRGRAATGFDMNLKQLMPSTPLSPAGYFVPFAAQESLDGLGDAVKKLRAEGHRVIVAVSESETMPQSCNGVLVQEQGEWLARSVSTPANEH